MVRVEELMDFQEFFREEVYQNFFQAETKISEWGVDIVSD